MKLGRRRRSGCTLCRPEPCTCDARERAAEAEANAILKAAGEKPIRDLEEGRLFGGHLEDKDRGNKWEQLGRLAHLTGVEIQRAGEHGEIIEAAPPSGHPLRHHADAVAARGDALALGGRLQSERIRDLIRAYRVIVAEARRIASKRLSIEDEKRIRELQSQILEMKFDGAGLTVTEIGAALGHGRQWASKKLHEIIAEAETPRALAVVAPECLWCGRAIAPRLTPGRKRKFCPAPRNCRKMFSRKRRHLGRHLSRKLEAKRTRDKRREK